MKSTSLIQPNLITRFPISYFIWPLFIIAAVYAFNFPYMFFDGLWHDDGYWFNRAVNDNVFMKFRGNVSTFAPYIDHFYSRGMLIFGTDFMHMIYVGIMALSSLGAYYFYRNVFQIKTIIAIPAATIPNILPSLIMPIGFNASYVLWQMPLIFLSLILLFKSNNTVGSKSYVSYWASYLLFYLALNVSVAGTFLIPSVFLFFFLLIDKRKLLTGLIRSLPFLLYGLYHLYKHSKNSHLTPVINSMDVVIDRAQQFIDMSNIFLIDQDYAIWLILGLVFIGLTGIFISNAKFNVFERETVKDHRIFVTFWMLCWIGSNSIAYLVVTPAFRAYDYAYVFNYGTIFLLIVGIVFCLYSLRTIVIVDVLKEKRSVIFIVFMIAFVGLQRVNAYHDSSRLSQIEQVSGELRGLFSDAEIPAMSQIVALDLIVPHQGVVSVNSGYIRYLTGRDDVTGLIGPDRFPLNPFASTGSWFSPMDGLDVSRPIVLFRHVNEGYERVSYMLQAEVNKSNKYPRLSWQLYDISPETTQPMLVSKGDGVTSYLFFMNEKFSGGLPYVAFSPGKLPDKIISKKQAKIFYENLGILQDEISYSNVLTLTSAQKVGLENKSYIQVLVRIDEIPKKKFKLGYKVNGEKKIKILGSSDYLENGDYLLSYYPLTNLGTSDSREKIQFYNVSVWPYKQIKMSGEKQ